MIRNKNNDKYITFQGRTYLINFKKLKEVCLNSSNDGGSTKEIEISQSYERSENGEFELSGKLEHETKFIGNTQNDMIVYDIVKLMLITLLENNCLEESFQTTLGTCLSLNTLINWGVIEEIE
jgi:hypothetical protein